MVFISIPIISVYHHNSSVLYRTVIIGPKTSYIKTNHVYCYDSCLCTIIFWLTAVFSRCIFNWIRVAYVKQKGYPFQCTFPPFLFVHNVYLCLYNFYNKHNQYQSLLICQSSWHNVPAKFEGKRNLSSCIIMFNLRRILCIYDSNILDKQILQHIWNGISYFLKVMKF